MDNDEIARIRSLPLDAVLESLGAQRDPKDPAHNWRLGGSRITVTDSRFYDHNGAGAVHRMRQGRAGGGGAIDLVQYVKDVGFREAMRELGGSVFQGLPRPAATRRPVARGSEDRRPPPSPTPDGAAHALWYLTAVRGIPTRWRRRRCGQAVCSRTRGVTWCFD